MEGVSSTRKERASRKAASLAVRQAERACCVSPPEQAALAAELARRTPGNLSRCFVVTSGSEANGQAFILARRLTGRPKSSYCAQ